MRKAKETFKVGEDGKQDLYVVHPQVSYFQAPLLEFAPSIISAFLNPHKKSSDPNYIFMRMRPLLNQYLLPIEFQNQQGKTTSFQEEPQEQELIDTFVTIEE